MINMNTHTSTRARSMSTSTSTMQSTSMDISAAIDTQNNFTKVLFGRGAKGIDSEQMVVNQCQIFP